MVCPPPDTSLFRMTYGLLPQLTTALPNRAVNVPLPDGFVIQARPPPAPVVPAPPPPLPPAPVPAVPPAPPRPPLPVVPLLPPAPHIPGQTASRTLETNGPLAVRVELGPSVSVRVPALKVPASMT